MNFSPFRMVEAVRASYWFVPSLMAAAAAVLGIAMVWLDTGPADGLLSGIGWYQTVKPDGAHEVLSTIAGSMITVAGVVFSITIVALGHAASQYGPRILTNFMEDRGHQVTLGTFIATFVYCLIVLRTIRGGDSEFVPQLAVMVGLLFAFCSIGVLIYFIHHVPQSIHVNHLVARVGRQLVDAVDDRFPLYIGAAPEEAAEDEEEPDRTAARALQAGEGREVTADGTGYVQGLSDERLMDTARGHDFAVRLLYRPGDFIHAGRALARVWPAERLTNRAIDELRGAFAVGNRRTPTGDLTFMIDELVEIAGRALSTGINDPSTAMTAIDWLGAGLSELARRRMPSPERADKEGVVRVLACPESFTDFTARGVGRMRQYVARDMAASLHLLDTLARVADSCCRKAEVRVLVDEVERLAELAGEMLAGSNRDAVLARADEVQARLRDLPGA
jgi:uncharacterized membrane protein